MLFYASAGEGGALPGALDDDSWGMYAAAVYAAAVKRRDGAEQAEGPAP